MDWGIKAVVHFLHDHGALCFVGKYLVLSCEAKQVLMLASEAPNRAFFRRLKAHGDRDVSKYAHLKEVNVQIVRNHKHCWKTKNLQLGDAGLTLAAVLTLAAGL